MASRPKFVRPPANQYSNLPVVGPWITRLGKVEAIYATPCSINKEVWIKAAWHSLPRLLYLKVKPFIQALQWDRLTRRNHAGKKGIARALSEFAPKAPILDTPGWAVFQVVGDLALKAEWYFMVIDRTTEGLLNFMSLAYVYSGCKAPGIEWITGSITGGLIIPTPFPKLIGPFRMTSNHGESVQGTISIKAGQTGVVNCTATIRSARWDVLPPSHQWTIECRELITDQTVFTISGGGDEGAITGGAGSAEYNTHSAFLTTYALFITGDFGTGYVENITFSAYEFPSGIKGVDFDP